MTPCKDWPFVNSEKINVYYDIIISTYQPSKKNLCGIICITSLITQSKSTCSKMYTYVEDTDNCLDYSIRSAHSIIVNAICRDVVKLEAFAVIESKVAILYLEGELK